MNTRVRLTGPLDGRWRQTVSRSWLDFGLGTKMMVLVLIGTLSLVSLFAYLGTAALSENTERLFSERTVLAETAASHMDYLLAGLEDVLVGTAAGEEWNPADRTNRVLERAFGRLGFYTDQVLLLDAGGALVSAYPPLPSAAALQDPASLMAPLEVLDFTVSSRGLTTGPLASSPIAAAAIRDPSGRLTAALAISVKLSGPNLRTLSRPIGLGESGYLDLVDSRLVILTSTRPERIGKASDGEALRGLVRANHPAVTTCRSCYSPVDAATPESEIIAFAPLERAPWGVAVRQSEGEVFAGTRLLQARIFALLVICLAGALVLVYLTTRSVIAPVQALTAATRRIAGGDLETPVGARGRDEIAVLANSFDSMRARLRDSMAEIQGLNRELDGRVRERTAALEKAGQENAELYRELQEKERLRRELLYRIFSAQEEERKRIARELHDETCQILTGMRYAVDNIEADAPTGALPGLEQVHALADQALDGVHRIIADLRPGVLDHLGLTAALRWYGEQRFSGLDIHFTIREIGKPRRLPPAIETALFRVGQEAINNIAQHADARHAVCVFELADDCIKARIADDGRGFDTMTAARRMNGQRGLGLTSMEERMCALGGTFRLRSIPGEGTVIRLHFPLE